MPRTSASLDPPVAAPRPDSPPARRVRLGRWRDPRLWVGVVLVVASVVVGARLLAAADDTRAVWAVARDVGAGAPLTRDALQVRRVRFADGTTAQRYVGAGEPLPRGAVAGRPLVAGELLPRASLDTGRAAAFELPVVVGAAGAPDDLRPGDVVDVWVAAGDSTDAGAPAERVLTAVPVVDAARSTGPFGEAATRQVLLGLTERAVAGLGPVLARVSTGTVVLVRHGHAGVDR